MAVTPFADSPRNGAWGDRPYALIDFPGPTSYTIVSLGPPITGGQAVDNTVFGLSAGLEGIIAVTSSSDGQYGVEVIPLLTPQGQPTKLWTLSWYVLHTGAEVTGTTNLSTVTVRLLAFGPY